VPAPDEVAIADVLAEVGKIESSSLNNFTFSQ